MSEEEKKKIQDQERETNENDPCSKNDGESHVVHRVCIHCHISFD